MKIRLSIFSMRKDIGIVVQRKPVRFSFTYIDEENAVKSKAIFLDFAGEIVDAPCDGAIKRLCRII